jgi:hypothetical protein
MNTMGYLLLIAIEVAVAVLLILGLRKLMRLDERLKTLRTEGITKIQETRIRLKQLDQTVVRLENTPIVLPLIPRSWKAALTWWVVRTIIQPIILEKSALQTSEGSHTL